MKPIVATVALLAVCLVGPASALADSGAITNVKAVGDGQVQATFTTTSTACTDFGFCGWFPEAAQVPAGQSCDPDDHLVYVGEYQSESGTQTATDTFYPLAGSVRLCLYIYGPDAVERLVAQYDYAPASAPTPPAPTPPSPTPSPETDDPGRPIPRLTLREARANLPHILRREYGSRFKSRRNFQRSCWRHSSEKVRCDARWDWRDVRYRGTVTMRNDPRDPESILYTTNIRRKRTKARSQPPAQPSCDPNYSGCLRPGASDYDCAGGSGDGPYYTSAVQVLGEDHHDLDRDGDGVACEDD